MTNQKLVRWAFETSTKHPRAFRPYEDLDQRAVDQIFTEDGRRVWCTFNGEQPSSRVYPTIREEPYLVVGHINIEDDSTTTSNGLTSCGSVIREVHASTRTCDIVGPVINDARLLEASEIEDLLLTVSALFDTSIS